jgi:hypothetical protein
MTACQTQNGPFEGKVAAGRDITNGCMGTDNSKMRWDIWSNPSACNYNNFNTNPNITSLLQKGYMCSPSDWKNMEMTALYFCGGGGSGVVIEHVMGGGRNTNQTDIICN